MTRLIVISTTTKLVTEKCGACHILFAFPKEMQESCKETGEFFYCPNGHSIHYTESENKILKHKLDQCEAAKATAIADKEHYRRQRDGALDQLTAKSKELQRIEKRIHAGVCPHCHRHFTNLERHVKGKHGTPKEQEQVKVEAIADPRYNPN